MSRARTHTRTRTCTRTCTCTRNRTRGRMDGWLRHVRRRAQRTTAEPHKINASHFQQGPARTLRTGNGMHFNARLCHFALSLSLRCIARDWLRVRVGATRRCTGCGRRHVPDVDEDAHVPLALLELAHALPCRSLAAVLIGVRFVHGRTHGVLGRIAHAKARFFWLRCASFNVHLCATCVRLHARVCACGGACACGCVCE